MADNNKKNIIHLKIGLKIAKTKAKVKATTVAKSMKKAPVLAPCLASKVCLGNVYLRSLIIILCFNQI